MCSENNKKSRNSSSRLTEDDWQFIEDLGNMYEEGLKRIYQKVVDAEVINQCGVKGLSIPKEVLQRVKK